MPVKRTHDHDPLLFELCTMLRNCANCRHCDPVSELGCYADLKITDHTSLYLDTYGEKTDARIIAAAESFGYEASVIKDGDDMWIECTRKNGDER